MQSWRALISKNYSFLKYFIFILSRIKFANPKCGFKITLWFTITLRCLPICWIINEWKFLSYAGLYFLCHKSALDRTSSTAACYKQCKSFIVEKETLKQSSHCFVEVLSNSFNWELNIGCTQQSKRKVGVCW